MVNTLLLQKHRLLQKSSIFQYIGRFLGLLCVVKIWRKKDKYFLGLHLEGCIHNYCMYSRPKAPDVWFDDDIEKASFNSPTFQLSVRQGHQILMVKWITQRFVTSNHLVLCSDVVSRHNKPWNQHYYKSTLALHCPKPQRATILTLVQ